LTNLKQGTLRAADYVDGLPDLSRAGHDTPLTRQNKTGNTTGPPIADDADLSERTVASPRREPEHYCLAERNRKRSAKSKTKETKAKETKAKQKAKKQTKKQK
jgi:hypothetical protein